MIQYSESIANALHSPVMYWGFPDSSVGKESVCCAGDLGSIPGLGRSPGEGKYWVSHHFKYSDRQGGLKG